MPRKPETERIEAEWAEGQRVTNRVAGQLRGPFISGTSRLSRIMGAIRRESVVDPLLNLLGAVDKLPVEEVLIEPVVEAWRTALMTVMMSSIRLTLRRIDVPLRRTKVEANLAEQLALEWLMLRESSFRTGIANTTNRAITETLDRGIIENRRIPQMARDLEQIIGLTPKQAERLLKLEREMRERGLPERTIDRNIQIQRKRMIKTRATAISRTETNAARNGGTLAAWELSVNEGSLDPGVLKIWIANDPCPICTDLERHEPIPLNMAFDSPAVGPIMAPPAHVNCRCSLGLTE